MRPRARFQRLVAKILARPRGELQGPPTRRPAFVRGGSFVRRLYRFRFMTLYQAATKSRTNCRSRRRRRRPLPAPAAESARQNEVGGRFSPGPLPSVSRKPARGGASTPPPPRTLH